MLANDHRSVTLSYTLALTNALDLLGLELPGQAKRILSEVNDFDRVPLDVQEEIWKALADAHQDPLLGVKLGQAIRSGQLGLAGYLFMTQGTLGAAVEQLLVYHPLVGEGGQFELRQGGQYVDVCYLPNYIGCTQLRVETVLSTCISQIRAMTGPDFRPQSVQLAFPAPSLAVQQEYQRLLETPVQFNAPVSAIRLRPQDMHTPLVAADRQVMAQLKPEADALLQSLNQKSLHLRVTHLLQQEPQLSREQVASRLCISARHLGRKLMEENISFREIQDQVRSHYACQWLSQKTRNNAEIAAALGYCDESAFGKAFRRWLGMSPKAYRKQQLAHQQAPVYQESA